tara:strand:- start:33 stop:419 length:387 start_codon:yes stop_codon:yes gene_type:complete
MEKNNNIPSNKNFGLVFSVIFLIIALWPLLDNNEIRVWSIILSIVFFIFGILNSKILNPFNKIWTKFGIILGNIIAPIVMAIIFFGVVTPTSILLKIFGKDILMLKKNRSDTYWINKDNSNNNMKNQF